MRRLLSVVVPAFDEAQRIAGTLAATAGVLRSAGEPFELIVSDDGSRDETVALCEDLSATTLPELRVLAGPTNLGKGAAVRRGMLAARGDVHAFIDADGSADPHALLPLVAAVRAHRADLAIASRYVGRARPHGQPLGRVLLSRACNALVQLLLLPGIADPNCGMKVFSRRASETLFLAQEACLWTFDIENLARARQRGMRILEHPIHWRDDPRSKVRWSHAWPTLRETLRVRASLERDAR